MRCTCSRHRVCAWCLGLVTARDRVAATNTTHLLWGGRWIEAVSTKEGWVFKSGRDAAAWLLGGET